MDIEQIERKENQEQHSCGLSRRSFLFYSGGALTTGTVMLQIPGVLHAQEAKVATYPRKLIAKMSQLELDQPVIFNYPKCRHQSRPIKRLVNAASFFPNEPSGEQQ